MIEMNVITKLQDLWLRFSIHIRFFFKFNLISKREFLAALILSTAVVLTETLGLAMTYPVLTFIETGGNPDLFRTTSTINKVVAEALEMVGLNLSLIPLMIATFCLISIRQIINFFSVVHHEFIKWSIGKRLGSQLIQVFLKSEAEFATSFKSGELTALVDYESQASASIMQTYLATWQVTVSFLMYFVVIVMVAPVPALLLIVFLGLISIQVTVFPKSAKHVPLTNPT